MTATLMTSSLSRKRRLLFYAVIGLAWTILFLCVCEFTLRIMGKGSWRIGQPQEIIEPGGKLYTSHPTLGYINLPGELKITLPNGYVFTITHSNDGLRLTHPLSHPAASTKEEIWIFGCSLTHGWSLNDEETYPWVLQQMLPQYEIVNFAVDGYGTLQQLIQFQEALRERKKPKFAIFTYAHFHDERNTFVRHWRKNLLPVHGRVAYPYARLDHEKGFIQSITDVEYHEFPLIRYSAFINFLEDQYNTLEKLLRYSHKVSKSIIKKSSIVAQENDVKFIVVGIVSSRTTRDMLQYAKDEGIMATDISVDLYIKANTNLPHDLHPSARANQQYAEKLAAFLKQVDVE